jgi:hypothetical protein
VYFLLNGKVDRYHMYWQGKSPKVKAAVEDYLGSGKPIKEFSVKHGVSPISIINHSRTLMRLYHTGTIDLPKILANTQTKEA